MTPSSELTTVFGLFSTELQCGVRRLYVRSASLGNSYSAAAYPTAGEVLSERKNDSGAGITGRQPPSSRNSRSPQTFRKKPYCLPKMSYSCYCCSVAILVLLCNTLSPRPRSVAPVSTSYSSRAPNAFSHVHLSLALLRRSCAKKKNSACCRRPLHPELTDTSLTVERR